jgi:hypothetical protein
MQLIFRCALMRLNHQGKLLRFNHLADDKPGLSLKGLFLTHPPAAQLPQTLLKLSNRAIVLVGQQTLELDVRLLDYAKYRGTDSNSRAVDFERTVAPVAAACVDLP